MQYYDHDSLIGVAHKITVNMLRGVMEFALVLAYGVVKELERINLMSMHIKSFIC